MSSPEPDTVATGRPWQRMAAWMPVLLTLLIHLPLLVQPTYIYDDLLVVLQDPRVSDLRWGEAWTGTYITGAADNLYRPLVTSSYLLQWWLHGDSALGFRIVNVLAHAGVTALVFAVGRRLVGWWPGWLGAMLFAVHPIHTEVVGSIAFRTESFAALAILGAMAIAAGELTAVRISAIGALLLAGLLSKEQALTIGPLVLLMWWACHDASPDPGERRRGWVVTLMMLWITAGYLIVRESLHAIAWDRAWLEWTFNAIVIAEGWDRVFFPVKLLGRYLWLLVWPARLTIDYGGITIAPQTEWSQPYVWVGLLGVVGVAALFACWVRRRQWRLLVCLAGASLTYFLVSNALIVIGTHFNERLFYLPSAFLLMLVGWAVARWPIGRVMVMTACIPLAIATMSYAVYWGDRERLYARNLAHTPGSIRLHLLLALEHRARGDTDQAAQVLSHGIERIPQSWEIWSFSAEMEAVRGNADRARQRLAVAWEMVPEHSRTYVGAARQRVEQTLREAER